ncbi:hypothetical protein OAP26_00035 [Flavobacteriaceae bacterium]|nr:hypothetical protein [Flavobacteriaceae bacterium]
MKKLLYLLCITLVFTCGSDDPVSTTPDTTDPTNETTDFNVTGTVADQTAAEAKKTIYGKWNLSGSRRISANSCAFNFIEFTDDIFIMSFTVYGTSETFSGTYVLNEDSDGTVSSVDLTIDIEGVQTTVATLTEIVVTETDDRLNATFNIVLNIPEGYEEYEICNGLDGDYECDKEDPMEESTTATEDSNHAKLTKTWNFVSRYQFNQDISAEWYRDICYIDNEDDEENTYIEGCTVATSISLTFSAYGTYTLTWNGSNQGVETETDVWRWSDDTQTAFFVGQDQLEISIETLTDTAAVFTEDDEYTEGDDDIITYTFSAN